MLFTTTTQWVAVAVALIAGWLFGLASHPGGRKWKQRYADERDAHAVLRKDRDTRYAELEARNKELERENSRLAKATPVTAATIAPRARTAATAAYPAGERRGWFDWGDRRRV
jgi:cell division protein FtsB